MMLEIAGGTCYSARMLKQILTLTAMAALIAPSFAMEWLDDFAVAKSKAQEKNKLILVDFTGSDWCGWCIKLRKEVLDTPEFDEYIKDKFLLMEVDCPRKKKLDPTIAQQNQQLCRQYNISGFPTVLVMNGEGEVVGGFGGYKKLDGVKATLDKAIKTDADIRAAKQLPAEQQAAALSGIYQGMDAAVRKAGGYKIEGEEAAAKQRADINTKLSACEDIAAAQKVLADAEPTILPVNKRFFLDRKFTVMVNAAETVEDLAEARKVADELITTLPAPYDARIKAQIEQDFADPAAFLEKLKAARAAEQAK